MSKPLYPQLDPNKYRGNVSRLAGWIGNRLVDRPLSSGLRNDVRQGAQGAYQQQIKPFVDFARNPGFMTGVGAAITLPPGSPFRARLAKKLGTTMGARQALERADATRLLLNKDNPRDDFMALFEPFEGTARPAGRYRIKDLPSKYGASVHDRVAIIQDPKTGTMFAAPERLHGDLMDWVADNVPGMPKSYPKWFQHELFDATPDIGAPARLMHGMDPRKDTEIATYARAKLIGKMGKAGIKPTHMTKAPSYRERLGGVNDPQTAALLREILNRRPPK